MLAIMGKISGAGSIRCTPKNNQRNPYYVPKANWTVTQKQEQQTFRDWKDYMLCADYAIGPYSWSIECVVPQWDELVGQLVTIECEDERYKVAGDAFVECLMSPLSSGLPCRMVAEGSGPITITRDTSVEQLKQDLAINLRLNRKA